MSASPPVNVKLARTPDDIAFELTNYRDSIRASLQHHEAHAHQQASAQSFSSQQLLRTLGSAQQYIQSFLRSNVSPSSVIQFVTKRPIAVGVAVGALALVGPRKLLGWAAKVAAVWRIASAVRGS